jgi:hypothetical protein
MQAAEDNVNEGADIVVVVAVEVPATAVEELGMIDSGFQVSDLVAGNMVPGVGLDFVRNCSATDLCSEHSGGKEVAEEH